MKAEINGRHRRATIGTANSTTESQIVSRRKAAKMLVVVVSMFAACYFPVHLLSIVRTIWDVPQNENKQLQHYPTSQSCNYPSHS
ncbi:hypothetical protein WDU94_008998 [Cyamophila willieti]